MSHITIDLSRVDAARFSLLPLVDRARRLARTCNPAEGFSAALDAMDAAVANWAAGWETTRELSANLGAVIKKEHAGRIARRAAAAMRDRIRSRSLMTYADCA